MSGIARTDLLAVVLLSGVCWLLRASFIVFWSADRLPRPVVRALDHLAPAALASICAVEVLDVLQADDGAGRTASAAILALSVLVAFAARRHSLVLALTVVVSAVVVLLVDLWWLA